MNGPIRRLAFAILVGFILLLLNVTYIQVLRGPTYRADERNPRVLIAKTSKERGLVVDRNGEVLARSVADPTDQSAFVREYPFGDAFVHSVGFSSLLFADRGIEDTYTEQLRSKQDLTISDIVSALLDRDLRPQNVITTLDSGLQLAAINALNNQAGSIVALNPRTGEILAYVSLPSYNPTPLLGSTSGPIGDALDADPAEPLLNRADSETYAPGSTFKIITTVAALDAGLSTPATAYENPIELALPGSTSVIRNVGLGRCGSGSEVTLAEAFRRSCNTIFGQLALDVGAPQLVVTAQAFGFNQDIPFEWSVLNSVIPPASSFSDDQAGLAQTGIGQRDLQATPLQMALVAAGIGNHGTVMAPYLVASVADSDGNVITATEPTIFSQAATASSAAEVAAMMVDVVASGTGTNAQISSVTVAGKTGTAETEVGAPHLWFVGFAPAENPTIAIAVIVESGGLSSEGGSGGSVAAPIARQVIAQWLGVSP